MPSDDGTSPALRFQTPPEGQEREPIQAACRSVSITRPVPDRSSVRPTRRCQPADAARASPDLLLAPPPLRHFVVVRCPQAPHYMDPNLDAALKTLLRANRGAIRGYCSPPQTAAASSLGSIETGAGRQYHIIEGRDHEADFQDTSGYPQVPYSRRKDPHRDAPPYCPCCSQSRHVQVGFWPPPSTKIPYHKSRVTSIIIKVPWSHCRL